MGFFFLNRERKKEHPIPWIKAIILQKPNRVVDPIKVIDRVERYKKKRSVRSCMCAILRGRKKQKGCKRKWMAMEGLRDPREAKRSEVSFFFLSLSLCFTDRVLCPEVIQEQLAHATQRHRKNQWISYSLSFFLSPLCCVVPFSAMVKTQSSHTYRKTTQPH